MYSIKIYIIDYMCLGYRLKFELLYSFLCVTIGCFLISSHVDEFSNVYYSIP